MYAQYVCSVVASCFACTTNGWIGDASNATFLNIGGECRNLPFGGGAKRPKSWAKTSGPWDPFLSPSSRLFIAKAATWDHDSSPRRAVNFILKQPCSPRRAGYFIMKLFGGPGEPEASLATGIKPLNSASKNQNISKGRSPDEIKVEGAANKDGRTPSIWDTFAYAGYAHGENGDVACDGYHKYKEDVQLMLETGLDAYRFSISWSRLLPNGRGPVNPKGLQYYNNLINELISNGNQPHATLHNFDLPQVLEDEYGGWISQKTSHTTQKYVLESLVTVLYWTTVNEPNVFALGGYDQGNSPPRRCSPPFCATNDTMGNSTYEPYLAVHHILLSHSSAARLYWRKYRDKQHGFVGISIYTFGIFPQTNTEKDRVASQRARERIPAFTNHESKQVKGSFDFIGVIHYTNLNVSDNSDALKNQLRDFTADMAANIFGEDLFSNEEYLITPWGLRQELNKFKLLYGNPPIFIHENGQRTASNSSLQDVTRVKYLHGYIGSVLDALRDGSNIKGYFAWSFLDLFELLDGYKSSFGLYYVDRDDPELKRYPKLSAKWYNRFLKGRRTSIVGTIELEKDPSLAPLLIRWKELLMKMEELLASGIHLPILAAMAKLAAIQTSIAADQTSITSKLDAIIRILNTMVPKQPSPSSASAKSPPMPPLLPKTINPTSSSAKPPPTAETTLPPLPMATFHLPVNKHHALSFESLSVASHRSHTKSSSRGILPSDIHFSLSVVSAATVRDTNLNHPFLLLIFVILVAAKGLCLHNHLQALIITPIFIWDPVYDHGENGDVACDGYHKYKEDVLLMVETGLEAYRFSISWSRLIPRIQPHVTLHNFDLPQALEDEYGGWISRDIIRDFTNYADVYFREFGDRVQYWTTVNEANVFALSGYDQGSCPPQRCSPPFCVTNITRGGNSTYEAYLAVHHILLSHSSAVRLYRRKYRDEQHGFVGISVYTLGFIPLTNTEKDRAASQRARDFFIGWIVEPLVHGDYPISMKTNAGARIPAFTNRESEQVKGIIHYNNANVTDNPNALKTELRDFNADMAAQLILLQDLFSEEEYPVTPWSLREELKKFKLHYGNPPIFIHENGQRTGTNSSLQDVSRVKYLHGYIGGVLDALRDGSNIKGYFAWSFLDVFELLAGYKSSFGLYYVDRNDPELKRYPKLSAKWYSRFLKGSIELQKDASLVSVGHLFQMKRAVMELNSSVQELFVYNVR
ncbi:Hydroxyisourate hydrolase [Glycine soja]